MMIKELFSQGIIKVASQPKDNALDIDNLGGKRVLLLPIDHDYPGGSASMHNAVFSKFDLPFRSSFVVADPANAESIVKAFREDPLYVGGGMGSGFKDKVAPFLDELDESAKAIGSVNVVAKRDGKLIGYNTDGVGFVNGLLNEYPDCISEKKVVILGAGGTALPIAYEISQHSSTEIVDTGEVVILNRTVAKAEKIAKLIARYANSRAGGEDVIGKELQDADVVINTSNKGAQPNEMYSAYAPMTKNPEQDMQVGLANIGRLPQSAIVADILLENDTLTLKMARDHGNRTHSGRHMNLYQAIPAIKIMTGIDTPDKDIENIMRDALYGPKESAKGAIDQLFDNKTVKIAEQPKNNALDINNCEGQNLLLIPIDHDYPGGSAAMHNAVFEHHNLPYRTSFVVGDPANAETVMSAFREDPRYVGGGVGSGFKDKVAPFLDGLDDSAKVIGSVNVVAKEDGKLIGYNTDGIGFANGLLAEYPGSIEGKKIVILGAGGTALPIAYELAKKKPSVLVICNRTVAKAQNIANLIGRYCAAYGAGEQEIGKEFKDADLVINTSNKGAQPNEKYSAFGPMTGDPEKDMEVSLSNLGNLPTTAIIADILLEDETLSLKMAKEHGNRVHNGQHMNLYQAVPAFKIMTKLDKADEELERIMRSALQ
ncbi:shikimate dehydrogenase [Candidatus Uabimicrobium sp. HlEnr_7]|uniref:shikimate dehydrogenase family protein n=1 Tax=Candidatus Uabimicrobium helgolandensis TaxID=3095367 RepID=UPI0035569CA2